MSFFASDFSGMGSSQLGFELEEISTIVSDSALVYSRELILFRTMWSRCRDVVLEGRTIDLGKPRGVGKLEWERNGEGEVSLRATWDQGGTRIAPRKEEGFQVSKRDLGERGIYKGNWQGELARGINKGLCHDWVLLICVYVLWYCVNAANKRIVFRL